jgi:hypothetical protein
MSRREVGAVSYASAPAPPVRSGDSGTTGSTIGSSLKMRESAKDCAHVVPEAQRTAIRRLDDALGEVGSRND